MRMFVRAAVGMACAAGLGACCCGPVEGDGEARMQRARQVWDAQGIDDYRMTVLIHAGLIAGAIQVEVRDGSPVSVQPAPGAPGMPPASLYQRFDTVEELFGIVEAAFRQDADEVRAEYHAEFGLPVEVAIDPSKSAIDEEHGFVVQGFTRT